jgi:cell division protein FtsZ
MADDVLRQAIQGISDLILVPGLINLDFADVKTIMSGMGVAMMGTGIGEGDDRAMQAAQKAIASPLLEDGSVTGARGVIINVTGGPDLSLMEVNEASCVIQEAAHEDANIIFGAVVDPRLKGKVKITVIATGFNRKPVGRTVPAAALETPVDLHNYTAHLTRVAEAQTGAAPAPSEGLQPSTVTRSASSAVERQASEDEPVAVRQAAGGPPQLTVNRRPILDLSLPTVGLGGGAGGDGPTEFGADLSSPLDIPAFLRRL